MESNGISDVHAPSTTDGSNALAEKEASLAVKVAVHIRPLIGAELYQGCKDCVTVIPGEPQVQIGNHSFTFDHVYGSTGSPSSAIFEECVSPLVEGLFHGYNATVLAYGQTGSGKTYTMGTGYTVGGGSEGVIPQVMEMIYKRVESLKVKAEIQLRVSFIEILKEEVHDLLDPNPPIPIKSEMPNGFGSKSMAPGKPPIQIRETMSGGITLAGVTETDVSSLEEMATCLEQGSLCRATASTNMNSRSSRSHAIFTITLEQRQKWDMPPSGNSVFVDDGGDDFLCAKLHLVDLAGSERAKRTGADGIRFKEGVHINKGLLALGNVISALGDDKKRKEGGHVPYRDSKLTRLLQDSLGGNSRTVMIACISPADSNAEETLNTLKYANRARNIQNKPVVNRDPMAAEMQRMRQQVELMQAELLCVRAGASSDEIQMLKQKNAWLEANILELRRELQLSHDSLQVGVQRVMDAQVERDKLQLKLELLRSGKTWEELDDNNEPQGAGLLETYAARIKELENDLQKLRDAGSQAFIFSQRRSVLPSMSGSIMDSAMSNGDLADVAEGHPIVLGGIMSSANDESGEMEEEAAAKEWEHSLLQDSMDKELQELNQRLEQKEAEMKTFVKLDGVVLKQHFEKKLMELEEEKKALQRERDTLLAEVANLAHVSDEQSHKMQENYVLKLKALESQIAELKKKQENQAQLLKQKQRSDEAAKRLQEEIQRIKTQKVQLQHKIKQESEHFRSWKASREKEVLQLKKEGRRNEYEMHKLQALNQRQKMVLQRKTEEASMATRRLKELLEARKPSPRDNTLSGAASANGSTGQVNEKAFQQWLDHELEVAVHVHEVRSNYEKQTDSRTALAKELAKLKQEHDIHRKYLDVSKHGQNESALSLGVMPASSMSPNARQAKIALLESMLNASSSTLVAMASQLSEAEERERTFSGRARWQHLRTMGDAKNLLQYIFNAAAYARCHSWDKELENKELKEKISELTELLRQNEAHRKETDRQQYVRDQYVAKALASGTKLQLGGLGPPRQLQYTDDLSTGGSGGFPYDLRKASRGLQGNNHVHHDEIEISDGESDMDIDDDGDDDQSDEDWNEDGERRVLKIRGPGEKSRVRKAKGDPNSDGLQEQQSLGPVQCEIEDGENKLKSESQVCCSCSQRSGCKTSKCECKAVGGLCGSNCGCTIRKCANRKMVDVEAEASEVAEAMETLRGNSTGDGGAAGNDEVKRAEQVLARHGASLLEDVWNDELQIESSSGKTDRKGDEVGNQDKGYHRRPLSDIGNTKVSEVEGQPKMKQRKRWQTALVQIVPVTSPQSATDAVGGHQPDQPADAAAGITATVSALEAATAAVAPNVVMGGSARASTCDTEAAHSAILPRDVVAVPVKLPWNGRKKPSPPSSPLRARNTHAAGSAEEGGLSKRLASSGSSASPRAPGRGAAEEKENV